MYRYKHTVAVYIMCIGNNHLYALLDDDIFYDETKRKKKIPHR